MASENIAKQLSCSWGWLPADPTADDVFFEEMAAQGQSFFAASGDDGAFDAAISPFFYPAEDQYVTTVGGTHLTTSGPGGAWISETVWNSEGAGSGGGISSDGIPQPSYQTGLATTANGGSPTLRNVPDVAMEADFDNYSCQAHACYGDWAGTSFAAPRWAGFMALVNQQAVEAGTAPSGGIGFLNPPLYQLAQGANAGNDLHDIVSGNNKTENQPVWFSAVAGYDLTTGWGSANGQGLIDDLAGPQVPGFWLTSLQSKLQLPIGGTGTTTIKITDAGGFTGGVNLAVTSTLPSGVTASFASNPATASDVLTFSADSSVVQQDLPVTVTGTSGSLTQSTNLTLSIHTPTFALVPSSNGFTLNPGNAVTATITVVPEYGFTGSVNLSIAGLPSGVTASFSPTSTTGTSTIDPDCERLSGGRYEYADDYRYLWQYYSDDNTQARGHRSTIRAVRRFFRYRRTGQFRVNVCRSVSRKWLLRQCDTRGNEPARRSYGNVFDEPYDEYIHADLHRQQYDAYGAEHSDDYGNIRSVDRLDFDHPERDGAHICVVIRRQCYRGAGWLRFVVRLCDG